MNDYSTEWEIACGMPPRDGETAAVNLISEYIEAITHELLYRRGIYDRNIFERERLYGIALHKSRHPELNLYISDSILSLKVCLTLEPNSGEVICKMHPSG